MSKRKRTPSPSDSASLALTRDNLRRLQESLSPPAKMSRRSSPTRTRNNLDARTKLEAYRIYVDTEHAYPSALTHFIDTVIRRPRDPAGLISPNARNVVEKRRKTATSNERTAISVLTPWLLFVGEADGDDRGTPVLHITAKQDIGLNKFFTPEAPNPLVAKTWGKLSAAQPDSCIGYVTSRDARNAGTEALFDFNEETILHDFSLTQYMHFPFLTAQWKVPNSNENLHSAQNQAARDGAAIVNQLYDLYATTDSAPPSVVHTCHFSVQNDLQHGGLWVHWREGDEHYMELVFDFSMRDQAALETLRSFLHNILDNALGPRLQSLKAVLPKFHEKQKKGEYPMVQPAADEGTPSESAVSQPPSLSDLQYNFTVPLTPSSAPSEPDKSRKRARYGSIT